ncbi:MAG TPA: NADPH:quinone oxidoreductase family protein [Usitatibacter sp.]|jgi:NADPH2:quinone reductase|nr:NADPH:quinone oxidoreductase family protein [Usitatibacter sp.]
MKALVCRALDGIDSLAVGELPSPVPGPGEVVIGVTAAGVNFPDVLMVQGKYQFKAPLPFAPGCEVAGIVKSVGEGVTAVQPGQPALAIMMSGGFAQEALAREADVVPLPAGVDLVQASAFLFTYGTSYHALKDRAKLAAGETLLVLGAAGGVGLAAVELGKLMGARVIAAASSPEKLALCRERGAAETIDYSREDLRERLKALTAGRGVDVTYDPVGGDYTEPALRSMGWNGRHLVVGFAQNEIPRIPLNLVLLKGCAVVGVFWGEFRRREAATFRANSAQLVRWLDEGRVKPHVSARYPLERGIEALRAVAERRAVGKVVIIPG